jgi:uracil-DNA glycosylase
MDLLPDAWAALLADDPEVQGAMVRLKLALVGRATIPAQPLLTAALAACAPAAVRVIVLGQDPYPTPGHACGLAFAVVPECRQVPRSLRNIQDEVRRELPSAEVELQAWAAQGVLLLNRWLSLDADLRRDWDVLTGACLRAVWQRGGQPVVALLWGRPAITHGAWMGVPLPPRRLVLSASHPSPLSCRRPCGAAPAFAGCGHFVAVNRFLTEHGASAIRW